MPQLSLVVSVYNEEDILHAFYEECVKVLNQSGLDAEIIFVDDGSKDASYHILKELENKDTRIKVLSFTRNFGHEAAMIAGIDHASTDVAICLDADLQNPPFLIPEMYQAYLDGHDVIIMARSTRKYGIGIQTLFTNAFYLVLNALAPVKIEKNASDFFLVSGDVLKDIQTNYKERTRFLRGMIQLLTVNKKTLFFKNADRPGGVSKYNYSKLFRLSFIAIASLSKVPLQFGLIIGVIFGIFSILLAIYSLIMHFIGSTPPGYTTLILFMSIAFSLQFFMMGIIGIYLGLIFDETKQRPIYILKSKV